MDAGINALGPGSRLNHAVAASIGIVGRRVRHRYACTSALVAGAIRIAIWEPLLIKASVKIQGQNRIPELPWLRCS